MDLAPVEWSPLKKKCISQKKKIQMMLINLLESGNSLKTGYNLIYSMEILKSHDYPTLKDIKYQSLSFCSI